MVLPPQGADDLRKAVVSKLRKFARGPTKEIPDRGLLSIVLGQYNFVAKSSGSNPGVNFNLMLNSLATLGRSLSCPKPQSHGLQMVVMRIK